MLAQSGLTTSGGLLFSTSTSSSAPSPSEVHAELGHGHRGCGDAGKPGSHPAPGLRAEVHEPIVWQPGHWVKTWSAIRQRRYMTPGTGGCQLSVASFPSLESSGSRAVSYSPGT